MTRPPAKKSVDRDIVLRRRGRNLMRPLRVPGCECSRCREAARAGLRARKLNEAETFLHSIVPITPKTTIRVIARIHGDRVLNKRYERFVPDPGDTRLVPGGRWVAVRGAAGK